MAARQMLEMFPKNAKKVTKEEKIVYVVGREGDSGPESSPLVNPDDNFHLELGDSCFVNQLLESNETIYNRRKQSFPARACNMDSTMQEISNEENLPDNSLVQTDKVTKQLNYKDSSVAKEVKKKLTIQNSDCYATESLKGAFKLNASVKDEKNVSFEMLSDEELDESGTTDRIRDVSDNDGKSLTVSPESENIDATTEKYDDAFVNQYDDKTIETAAVQDDCDGSITLEPELVERQILVVMTLMA